MNHRFSTYIGAFSVLLGALLFSAKAVLIKTIYLNHPEIKHMTLLTLRMGFSLPFFVFIAIFQKSSNLTQSKLQRKEWSHVLLLAFVGYYMSSVFDFWGLEYVTASLERLILFIYPTIVVLISLFFLNKKPTKVIYLSLILAYLGIFMVLYSEDLSNNRNIAAGSVLIFLAAVTYAIYIVGSERMILSLGNTRYTSLVMSFASLFVIIHFVIVNPLSDLLVTRDVLLKVLYMAVFCTVIPSFLISEGIKKVGSSNAAVIASIGPVSTIILADYFLGENISSEQVIGTLFVLAGVLIISLYGKGNPI